MNIFKKLLEFISDFNFRTILNFLFYAFLVVSILNFINYLYLSDLVNLQYILTTDQSMFVFLMFFILIYFSRLVLRYLNHTTEFSQDFMRTVTRKILQLEHLVNSNKDLIKETVAAGTLTDKQKNEIAGTLLETAKNVSIKDLTESAISEASEILVEHNLEELNTKFDNSLERMINEIDSLGRRGNLNLLIGILTTLSGFVIFYLLALHTVHKTPDFSLLNDFLPRFSLVLLIELFAYFFLGLYKTSLSEIKYFQNEITNIESRQIALQQALILGDKTTIKKLLESLSNTERNFILKKGETTLSQDAELMSVQNQKKLSDLIIKTVSKIKDSNSANT